MRYNCLYVQVESKYLVAKDMPFNQLVNVCVDGMNVSGTTSGNQPLLVSVNEAQFSTPAVLNGFVLLFQAKSNPQLVPAVTGLYRLMFTLGLYP